MASRGPTALHSPGSLDIHGLPPGAGWEELEAAKGWGVHAPSSSHSVSLPALGRALNLFSRRRSGLD